MNPIAATGLISLGKTLLENTLLKPSGPSAPPDGDAFLQMLDKRAAPKPKALLPFLLNTAFILSMICVNCTATYGANSSMILPWPLPEPMTLKPRYT